MNKTIKINALDNVVVALEDISSQSIINVDQNEVTVLQDVPRGHKISIKNISANENIVKYGCPIGYATRDIKVGEWVHVENVKTNLSEGMEYQYNQQLADVEKFSEKTFMGYNREDGTVGVRNEIWVIPTVGCVNDVAKKIAADNEYLAKDNIEGIHAFVHPYGCSQMGEDHETTKKILAALAKHPNAGAVLIVALGCENNTMEQFKEALGDYSKDRIRFMVCQEEDDELEKGKELLEELAVYANKFEREPISVSKLVVGLKCGGSDGLSGITANPVVGKFSDIIVGHGGSAVLTEVPEMFGAETLLMNRCINEEVFNKTVDMVNGFKDYFTSHNQVVYENPSPGNKAGGITTLEDKSLGCVQKGGTSTIVDVIKYGDKVRKTGLTLLSGPGNDLVAATVLAAAGAHIVLFTTGRGTPFGSPVPTVKISSNSELYEKKKNWIDFNSGSVVDGETIEDAGYRLFSHVIEVAEGKKTKSEVSGYKDLAIFKDGVTL